MIRFLMTLIRKGGSGSGNFGHAGRPGKVGGSTKNGGAANDYMPKITQAEKDFAKLVSNGNMSRYDEIVTRYFDVMEHDIGGGDGQAERETAMLMASMGITANEAGRILALRYEMTDLYDNNTLFDFFDALNGWGLSDLTVPEFDDLAWIYKYSNDNEFVENILYLKRARFGLPLVKDYVENVYTHDFGDGFRTEATEIKRGVIGENLMGFRVQGKVYRGSEKVGEFVRGVLADRGDVDFIKHEYFVMNKNVRGKGFGTEYYQYLEKEYTDRGVPSIALHADLGVGGYAWARMGYDFEDDDVARDMTSEFKVAQNLPEGDGEPWHSWDIAGYVSPDGKRVGKEFMLNTDWIARKDLEGYQGSGFSVGRLYYDAKKAEKDMQ